MRTAAYARLVPLLTLALLTDPPPARAGAEQDQYEDRSIARSAERAARSLRSDRALWVKVLEEAFPGKVGNPLKEEEYEVWFELLAGEADEWRRDSATTKPLTELYDRTAQRLELGPVPTIKKDEFMRYARRVLREGNPRGESDQQEDADKVFRVLDRNGDGMLAPEEFTAKLREEQVKADADANGRIDKDEYRESYRRRVTVVAEIQAKERGDGDRGDGGRGSDPKAPAAGGPAVPVWFGQLDEDKDGQVALHEWRKGGRELDAYMKMDLDGDGLLTPEEYARFVKLNPPAAPPKP